MKLRETLKLEILNAQYIETLIDVGEHKEIKYRKKKVSSEK